MIRINQALSRCEDYKMDYIQGEATWNGACGQCQCNADECTLVCGDNCESCTNAGEGCVVYSEENKFDADGLYGYTDCTRVSNGRDAGSTYCEKSSNRDSNSDQEYCDYTPILDGSRCTCRQCSSSYDGTNEIIDCSNVDGTSYVDNCNDIYRGVLGRQYPAEYYDAGVSSYVGRCSFDTSYALSGSGLKEGGGAGGSGSGSGSGLKGEAGGGGDNDDKVSMGVIIAIAVGGLVVVILIALLVVWLLRRPENLPPSAPPVQDQGSAVGHSGATKTVPIVYSATADSSIHEPVVSQGEQTTISADGKMKTTITTTRDSKITVKEVINEDGSKTITKLAESF